MILVAVPPLQPSRSKTVAVASTAMIERNVSQPIDDQPRDDTGDLLADHPERRPGQDHRRRRSPFAGDGDDPAEGEAHDDADDGDEGGLPERDPEAEDECGIRDPEDRDIGREPRPEQVTGPRGALGLGDDLDAGRLDSE
jgi:hypothetical protein